MDFAKKTGKNRNPGPKVMVYLTNITWNKPRFTMVYMHLRYILVDHQAKQQIPPVSASTSKQRVTWTHRWEIIGIYWPCPQQITTLIKIVDMEWWIGIFREKRNCLFKKNGWHFKQWVMTPRVFVHAAVHFFYSQFQRQALRRMAVER